MTRLTNTTPVAWVSLPMSKARKPLDRRAGPADPENLDHRGAVGADPLMGDGAGLLIQIPDQFFREKSGKQGVNLPPAGEYGVGMCFLPQEAASRVACRRRD